ncbi:putative toxin-antitoxin system toxin component, PIN family [Propionivibrio sp.]|uniref:putative toxin-antitoxin system toxin component, PIN family n=1 Tax=Propionivibrio sp. TaxID=2212460 RepID=UPI0025F86215|nr:putative toxin-antitoxin system toxin component, PIN family [Propionivibrio sp.]MBK7356279.1 putative toxin-antitoxin system toxin component, PIN family [Propionivibrio sp.]MBK8746180.1 putative toxin-antitoxin system toxin component, PIN family [Propionivibrio sp.]MBK8894509.1 putative toxin-antitoxin system toxin component, PIN family [Propionivibrio sp.]MBL0208338.1 putative toxin-antitoxin system toxin component, PIN family [Propionivibrio sp.]
MRLVLDTNIVMDMLHFGNHHAQPLKTALDAGEMLCFSDKECLTELERIVCYPEFGLDLRARQALIENYRKFAAICNASGHEDYLLPCCRDPDDQKFLILAARCKADLLITRDKGLLKLAGHRHKPPPCPIVTAEAACRLLDLAPEHPAGFI